MTSIMLPWLNSTQLCSTRLNFGSIRWVDPTFLLKWQLRSMCGTLDTFLCVGLTNSIGTWPEYWFVLATVLCKLSNFDNHNTEKKQMIWLCREFPILEFGLFVAHSKLVCIAFAYYTKFQSFVFNPAFVGIYPFLAPQK